MLSEATVCEHADYITLGLGLTAQYVCMWETLANVSNADYTDLSHSSLKICPHLLLNAQSLMGHEVGSHLLGLITINLNLCHALKTACILDLTFSSAVDAQWWLCISRQE